MPTILELNNVESWYARVSKVVRRHIPIEVRRDLLSVPGDKMFSDTLHFLADAFAKAGYHSLDESLNQIDQDLRCQFSNVRGYHACKPLSIEGYFTEGILPLTRERLVRQALDLLGDESVRPLVDKSACEADLETRIGVVCFATDRGDLESNCGHYLIRGSEALCCLEFGQHSELSRRLEHARRVKGIPTVLESEVPLELIQQDYLTELRSTLVTRYFQLRSSKPTSRSFWYPDWSFRIACNLPPSHIVGHYHPASIRDPRNNSVFVNQNITCPHCQ